MKAGQTTRSGWLTHLPVQGKMLLAFGFLLMVVLANAMAFFYVQARQQEARQWALHTYQVLNELQELLVQALNQQTGLRGYQISRDNRFLENYRSGEAAFAEHLETLRELTRDNADQRPRLDRIETVLQTWRSEIAKPTLESASTPEQAAILVRNGKKIFDQLRITQREMQDAETKLLAERTAEIALLERLADWVIFALLLFGALLVVASLRLMQTLLTQPLSQLTGLMTQLSDGDHSIEVPDVVRRDEIGSLARALLVFKTLVIDIQQRNWVKTHAAEIASQLQAAEDRKAFANTLTSALAPLLNAGVAAFYVTDADGMQLEMSGSYGYPRAKHGQVRYRLGEGLPGQCALERKRIVIDTVPPDYVQIHSGTGEAPPKILMLLPVQTRERLLAVIEFGSFAPFDVRHQALLDELLPTVALSLENLQRALRTKQLLEESQALSEELQTSSEELRVQQEELRTTNESLQFKSEQLKEQSSQLIASEEELRVQADELQSSNEELRQRGSILTEQKKTLEALQVETQQKADELARASQYKSEFLANMSHELRTPLNSLLILSRGLADNEDGHLSADEVESATVIHESGGNLLRLINDILDLSKVESGKMELVLEDLNLSAFAGALRRNFRHVAKERGVDFTVEIEAELPASVETDGAKLEQITNNLLSNAFKFTRQGAVRVQIGHATASGREGDLAICVSDTGIGIEPDKFEKVFQAFEQVDGSTSRQFGGTGLGLSIARGMAQLLGGDIRLESTPGSGSTFTLLIPLRQGQPRNGLAPAAPPAAALPLSAPIASKAAVPSAPAIELPDDRHSLLPGETVILIIEDDPAFARILIDFVRRKGYRALFAGAGEVGLALAAQFRPTGILLDVMLPGMDGFSVIERLKSGHATRHIPVHFISATDDHNRGLDLGAVGFLTKPVTREGLASAFDRLLHFAEGSTRRVLVVDDDAASRLAVRKLIGAANVEITEAAGGADALKLLQQSTFDCVILDLGMADVNGFEFLERAAALPVMPPVVVYSGRDLSTEETLKLREYTDSIVIKGARSPERLLDEVSLFLHSIREAPVTPKHAVDTSLNGHTVLVVDDDMRNIFALSKALRAKGLTVVMAQDGQKALRQLDENASIELVLMDIMMPGMDGYQTMGEIRKIEAHAKLPIIALTAKAMRGDREKCLEAGANDYLAKPIDLDKLFSMMRVWLAAR